MKLRKTVMLSGDYSFDALSPAGRWMYLIHYTSPKDPLQYEVVALDLRSGKLNSEPIVDPRERGLSVLALLLVVGGLVYAVRARSRSAFS